MKNFKTIFALIAVVSLFFSSCTMEKRKYRSGFYTSWNTHPDFQKTVDAALDDNAALTSDRAVQNNIAVAPVAVKSATVFVTPKIKSAGISTSTALVQKHLAVKRTTPVFTITPQVFNDTIPPPSPWTVHQAKQAFNYGVISGVLLLTMFIPGLIFLGLIGALCFSIAAVTKGNRARNNLQKGSAEWKTANTGFIIGLVVLALTGLFLAAVIVALFALLIDMVTGADMFGFWI